MKSFKELIKELDTAVEPINELAMSVKPPFLILSPQRGSRYRVEAEIITDNLRTQNAVLDKYENDVVLVPSKYLEDVKIGDTIKKIQIKNANIIKLSDLHEEEILEDYFILDEAVAKKTVRILKGKRKVTYRCPPGHHKTKPGSKTCVRTTGKRKYTKSRAMKRAARKRRGHYAAINRSRQRSMRKRRGMGL